MVGFKGSDLRPAAAGLRPGRRPGKIEVRGQRSEISFFERKAAHDPAVAGVPDPVGSGVFALQKVVFA